MKKVVCISKGVYGDGWDYNGPDKGEICTVIKEVRQGTWLFYQLAEYNFLMQNGARVDYNAKAFRPVDETFGEEGNPECNYGKQIES